MNNKISLAVITHNEEANIGRCLRSVAGIAGDIVVVDAQSGDSTAAMAEKLGARVFVRPWPGFAAQRRFAFEQAVYDWILWLDADEWLSPELAGEIRGLAYDAAGYEAAIMAWYLGRWIRHGNWYPGWSLRLFDRRKAAVTDLLIHESVEVQGAVLRLRNPILHFPYPEIRHHLEKMDNYTTLIARQRFAAGRRASPFLIAVSPVFAFIKTYVLQRGFLDGAAGLAAAIMNSIYTAQKYLKLYELSRNPAPAPDSNGKDPS